MLRYLPFVLLLALYIYAFIDLATSPRDEVRVLPRLVWLLVMIVIPVLGVVGWLLLGRPVRRPRGGGGGGIGRRLPRPSAPSGYSGGPVAPDDDPDFLHKLDELRRKTDEGKTPPDAS
jgi:hypothetical protein